MPPSLFLFALWIAALSGCSAFVMVENVFQRTLLNGGDLDGMFQIFALLFLHVGLAYLCLGKLNGNWPLLVVLLGLETGLVIWAYRNLDPCRSEKVEFAKRLGLAPTSALFMDAFAKLTRRGRNEVKNAGELQTLLARHQALQKVREEEERRYREREREAKLFQ
jgi:hypothetical protein